MIKLIKPYISYSDVEGEFREIFESGVFTRGKYVDQFTNTIKKFTGAKYAFLTSSATTALSICLKILGIGPGDEVVCSDFSFPASANVIEDTGAKPVFADVSLKTYNMLPSELEKRISSKTRAVILVDALGNPSGAHAIKEICNSRNLPLIEDSACSIGSSESNVQVGNIADLSCFSFHPRKLLTTGEGGAITTNNPKYAEILSVKLLHGAVAKNEMMDFVDYGYNYRLPDLQCVMGLKQFTKIKDIVRERNETRSEYVRHLHPMEFIVQEISENTIHNVQSLVFRMPPGKSRPALTSYLKTKEIESTLGTYSLSSTTYYSKKYNDIQKNGNILQNETITLPCYKGVNV
ncbi:MAG: DegT/DnrJ/EryC1/StrS family aminotransferase, partial [Leptospiraceae bacterium]|nr:DegT/DnrJ/EryC1/StrS family aminotransferase [Leptospiraceae bacterium]